MTTQKSPEDIAKKLIKDWEGVYNIDPNPGDYPLRIDLISRIAAAIKAERENIQHTYKQQNIRMTNNRLVLPERKIYPYDTHQEKYEPWVEGNYEGFNECLDEITRLNEGRVKPDAVWEDILIEKNNEDIGTHMNISLDDFINCYSNMKLNTKYRVEFYKLDEGEK